MKNSNKTIRFFSAFKNLCCFRVDRFWMEKKELTGFSPPDRPRQWKKHCFDLLRKSVKDR